MKLFKREVITLFIFAAFILMGSISIATYQTAVVEEQRIEKQIQTVSKQEVKLNKEEQEILDYMNEYRKQNGLSELKVLANLQEVAKSKAIDMVNNNYFSHTSQNLGTPFEMLKNEKVSYKIAGENLAGSTTPKKAFDAWKKSKLHNKNMLEEEFEYTGICVIDSPMYGKMFVQIFIGVK